MPAWFSHWLGQGINAEPGNRSLEMEYLEVATVGDSGMLSVQAWRLQQPDFLWVCRSAGHHQLLYGY